jgi:hypothetical protein
MAKKKRKNKRNKKNKKNGTPTLEVKQKVERETKYGHVFTREFFKEYTMKDDTVCEQFLVRMLDRKGDPICMYKMSTLANYPAYQMDSIRVMQNNKYKEFELLIQYAIETRVHARLIHFSPDFFFASTNKKHGSFIMGYIERQPVFVKNEEIKRDFDLRFPIEQSTVCVGVMKVALVDICQAAYRSFTFEQVRHDKEIAFISDQLLSMAGEVLKSEWVNIGCLEHCEDMCVGFYNEDDVYTPCNKKCDYYYRYVYGDIHHNGRQLLVCNNCFDNGDPSRDELISFVAFEIFDEYMRFKKSRPFMEASFDPTSFRPRKQRVKRKRTLRAPKKRVRTR